MSRTLPFIRALNFFLAAENGERYHRPAMSRIPILVVLAVACIPCLADDAPPKPTSPAAVAADKEFQHAVDVAEQAYKTAKAAATKRLVDKLTVAMKAATRAGNLAEANAIDAAIKAAQDNGKYVASSVQDSEAGVTYWVWRWHYAEGEGNVWVLADGRCVNHQGKLGRWKRYGTEVKFDWGFERDAFTLNPDKTFVGKNTDTGKPFTGQITGTNLSGGPPPPGIQLTTQKVP